MDVDEDDDDEQGSYNLSEALELLRDRLPQQKNVLMGIDTRETVDGVVHLTACSGFYTILVDHFVMFEGIVGAIDSLLLHQGATKHLQLARGDGPITQTLFDLEPFVLPKGEELEFEIRFTRPVRFRGAVGGTVL